MKNRIDDMEMSAEPRPWKHNPSSWAQRGSIAALASVAAAIAVYMSLYQWRIIDSVWDPVFGEGSERVLDSDVSHAMRRWMLIPDAALGAFGYGGDVIFALAGSARRWQYRPWLVMVFGLDVIPLGIVSAILVFMQGAVVGSWCFLCLVTAVIALILVVMAFDEVYSSFLYLLRVWRRSRDPRLLWDTFWGRPSVIAHEEGEAMSRETS